MRNNNFVTTRKYCILILLFLGSAILSTAQEKNSACAKFRHGKFTSSFVKHSGFTWIMERKDDDIQTEYVKQNTLEIVNKFKVKWYSDCFYVLKFISCDKPDKSPLKAGDSIQVFMEHVISDNSVKVKSVFKARTIHDTLTRIN